VSSKGIDVLIGQCDNIDAGGEIQIVSHFLLPQANGRACVDFGCIHPIDGLF